MVQKDKVVISWKRLYQLRKLPRHLRISCRGFSCEDPAEMQRLLSAHVDYFMSLPSNDAKIGYINHLHHLGEESAEYRKLAFHVLQRIDIS